MTDTDCSGGSWYCLDRDTGLVGMVAWHNTFTTGMADGTCRNVVDGGASTVTVSGGSASLTIPAKSTVAFYDASCTCTVGCDDPGGGGGSSGSTVSATFDEYAPTTSASKAVKPAPGT
ncbi:hypothetical protein [Streptomyces sp. NPDC057616]|uniref:hypothetical protein n=1 Tax=Streptomyces sp. NPDC057616 TaxID=3346183 RepID=UPI0036889CF5